MLGERFPRRGRPARHLKVARQIFTTAASGFTLVTDLTITPGAGLWRATVTGFSHHTQSNASWRGAIHHEGVIVDESRQKLQRGGAQGNVILGLSSEWVIETLDGETIEYHVTAGAGGGTATFERVALVLQEVI